MSVRGSAFIAGAFEPPRRNTPDLTVAETHAEVALGALADAGLTTADVDGYYCAGDAPGFGAISMADYLGLRCRSVDTTETGGPPYLRRLGPAAAAPAARRADAGAVTLGGNPR